LEHPAGSGTVAEVRGYVPGVERLEDRITPINGALPAFKDDGDPTATPPVPPQTDALTYSGTYKVVFLAFPFEAYGSATQKSNLVTQVMTFFGP
jgi:hypothetical protein